jgi:ketosteroid isomerase-like protein
MDRHEKAGDTLQAWLEMWLMGWRAGDAEMILRSVADDFVYDDPVDGRFRKAEFAVYLEEMLASEAPFVTSTGDTVFEEISHVATQQQDGELTAWGWWQTASVEGAGLVRVGPTGVLSEKTAYYSFPQ